MAHLKTRIQIILEKKGFSFAEMFEKINTESWGGNSSWLLFTTRLAPTSYKWDWNPYHWVVFHPLHKLHKQGFDHLFEKPFGNHLPRAPKCFQTFPQLISATKKKTSSPLLSMSHPGCSMTGSLLFSWFMKKNPHITWVPVVRMYIPGSKVLPCPSTTHLGALDFENDGPQSGPLTNSGSQQTPTSESSKLEHVDSDIKECSAQLSGAQPPFSRPHQGDGRMEGRPYDVFEISLRVLLFEKSHLNT